MVTRRRLFLTIGLLFGAAWACSGCMTTLSPGEYSKHYRENVEVTTADSSRYSLAPNWKIDSTNCLRGRGAYVKNDSSQMVNVNIPLSGVGRIAVEDDITPIYFELLVATVLFIHFL
jgi:hypothetical protein